MYEDCVLDEDCVEGLECAMALTHPSITGHFCTKKCEILESEAVVGTQCQEVGICGTGCCWITGKSMGPDAGEYTLDGYCAASAE
jgi:hypothetical protein